jgi:hypothetical protein
MGVLGIGSKPRSSSSDDVFALPFDDYLSLSDEEREAVQLRAYQTHQAWINAELERRGRGAVSVRRESVGGVADAREGSKVLLPKVTGLVYNP